MDRFCTATARIRLQTVFVFVTICSLSQHIEIYEYINSQALMYRKTFHRWEAFKGSEENIKSHFKFLIVSIYPAWKMLDSSFCLQKRGFPALTWGSCEKNYIGGLIPQDQEYHWRTGSWTNAVQPVTINCMVLPCIFRSVLNKYEYTIGMNVLHVLNVDWKTETKSLTKGYVVLRNGEKNSAGHSE